MIINVRLMSGDEQYELYSPDLGPTEITKARSKAFQQFRNEVRENFGSKAMVRLHVKEHEKYRDGEYRIPMGMMYACDQIVVVNKQGNIIKWLKDRTGQNSVK